MPNIEFIPVNNIVGDFPPIPLKKSIPEWYKDLDNIVPGLSFTAKGVSAQELNHTVFSIKKCVPIQDYLTSGYLLRFPSEVLISTESGNDRTETFHWRCKMNNVVATHSHMQCPIKIEDKRHHYIKFSGGYLIKTPPGYSCLFYQPQFFFENRFSLFSAIVDTDTYDDAIQFPGYITGKEEDFKIDAGTPLIAVFPFKRENWNSTVSTEPYNATESKMFKKIHLYFSDIYRNFFHSAKNYK